MVNTEAERQSEDKTERKKKKYRHILSLYRHVLRILLRQKSKQEHKNELFNLSHFIFFKTYFLTAWWIEYACLC